MDKGGKITAIIQDQVQRLVAREGRECLLDAPSVFLLGFTLPSENWNASSRDPNP